MSNYLGKAYNPKTGQVEKCFFLDDYYGKRKYAVRFEDGSTYKIEDIRVVDEHGE